MKHDYNCEICSKKDKQLHHSIHGSLPNDFHSPFYFFDFSKLHLMVIYYFYNEKKILLSFLLSFLFYIYLGMLTSMKV